MDKKSQTIQSYNASAKALAEKFNNTGVRVADIEKTFSYFTKTTPNVLEIGCGNGRDASEILRHTKSYLGIDVSEELIKIAREHVPTGHFQVHDVEGYDFPPNLDIIFAFASLLHTDRESLGTVLQKARGALNVNGIFFISLKYGDYREEIKTDEFGIRTFYFYTPEVIKELAGKGYASIHQEVQDLRGQKWFSVILEKLEPNADILELNT